MRLKTLRADRWPGQSAGGGLLLPRAAVLALALPGLALSGCETPSFERASGGPTVYLDQVSDAAKAAARQTIVESLKQGVAVYDLGIGDEIEIFFHIERKPTRQAYIISAADKLRIEFLGDTENNRTLEVLPDGTIDMPLVGPVNAAGRTATGLAHELERRYSGQLTQPKITVSVTEWHSPLDDFIAALGTSKGRTIVDKVLPDGTLVLPLLPPIPARGRTVKEVQQDIDAGYAAKHLDVFVSLVPTVLNGGSAMVIGEVTKPAKIDLSRPVTVAMAVAQAGGILPTGAANAVRVFYIGKDGVQRIRSINLNDVLDNLKLEDDMIVPANSIIYVPPSELAKAGRLMDAVMRDILRYQGFSLSGAYLINSSGGGTTVLPTTSTK